MIYRCDVDEDDGVGIRHTPSDQRGAGARAGARGGAERARSGVPRPGRPGARPAAARARGPRARPGGAARGRRRDRGAPRADPLRADVVPDDGRGAAIHRQALALRDRRVPGARGPPGRRRPPPARRPGVAPARRPGRRGVPARADRAGEPRADRRCVAAARDRTRPPSPGLAQRVGGGVRRAGAHRRYAGAGDRRGLAGPAGAVQAVTRRRPVLPRDARVVHAAAAADAGRAGRRSAGAGSRDRGADRRADRGRARHQRALAAPPARRRGHELPARARWAATRPGDPRGRRRRAVQGDRGRGRVRRSPRVPPCLQALDRRDAAAVPRAERSGGCGPGRRFTAAAASGSAVGRDG